MLTALVIFLTVAHVLTSVLLIVVILMQASKEAGGFGVTFGGGATETVFGSRAGNVLTKATVVLASVLLVTTLSLAKLAPLRAHAAFTAPAPVNLAPEAPPTGEGEVPPPAEAAPGTTEAAPQPAQDAAAPAEAAPAEVSVDVQSQGEPETPTAP